MTDLIVILLISRCNFNSSTGSSFMVIYVKVYDTNGSLVELANLTGLSIFSNV